MTGDRAWLFLSVILRLLWISEVAYKTSGTFGTVPNSLVANYCNVGGHVCQEGVGDTMWDHGVRT